MRCYGCYVTTLRSLYDYKLKSTSYYYELLCIRKLPLTPLHPSDVSPRPWYPVPLLWQVLASALALSTSLSTRPTK